MLPCRLWERKERVTEQWKQGEDEKKRKRRLHIHPRTFPSAKAATHSVVAYTHTDTQPPADLLEL